MLAAPKTYGFWTKIYLDGLGIGSVEDRGWAIVNAWNRWYHYDRIDVWMWYGDEGLRRANFWGKRTVAGYKVDNTSATSIDYKNVPAPLWATVNLKKTDKATEEKVYSFTSPVTSLSPVSEIKNMQSVLHTLWYALQDEVTWTFWEKTRENIINFQLDTWVIQSINEVWAWHFWPKTREKINSLYVAYLELENKKKLIEEDFDRVTDIAAARSEQIITSFWNPRLNDISDWVREMQKNLALLWYFDHKDTAIFGNITRESIIRLQMDTGVIQDKNSSDAWVFWSKTKNEFKKLLAKKILLESISEKEDKDIYMELLTNTI